MYEYMCPACETDAIIVLGILGDLAWFRCESCGMEFSIPVAELPIGDDEDD
jgi:transposase-like protein